MRTFQQESGVHALARLKRMQRSGEGGLRQPETKVARVVSGGKPTLGPGHSEALAHAAQIRVQERAQCLALGALPRSITAVLTDDLADAVRPGGVLSLSPDAPCTSPPDHMLLRTSRRDAAVVGSSPCSLPGHSQARLPLRVLQPCGSVRGLG